MARSWLVDFDGDEVEATTGGGDGGTGAETAVLTAVTAAAPVEVEGAATVTEVTAPAATPAAAKPAGWDRCVSRRDQG